MKIKQKPLTLACYLCGRQFGTKSLQIHLKACKEKFHLEQKAKQKLDRIILPEEPALLPQMLKGNFQRVQEYNQAAIKLHKYKILPACRFCGRTFNQQSLKVHEKGCTKRNSDEGYKLKKEEVIEETIKKPRTLVCCVCGRQFGLTSLKIHYPQCVQKMRNQQLKKPKKERRDIPALNNMDLQLINSKEDWTTDQIQSFNAKSSLNFKDKGMVYCENCKRTFMPEPFKRHKKNCELINGKNVQILQQKNGNQMYQQPQVRKPKVLVCHICGRQFGLLSLTIHQRACRKKSSNNQKQKKRSERRAIPEIDNEVLQNFDFANMQKWTLKEIESYNEIANGVYRAQSMVQCTICHRKFIEQSFKKHQGYCQRQNQKNIGQMNEINNIKQKARGASSLQRKREYFSEQKVRQSPRSLQKTKQANIKINRQSQKINKLNNNFCKRQDVIKELDEQLQETKRQEQFQSNKIQTSLNFRQKQPQPQQLVKQSKAIQPQNQPQKQHSQKLELDKASIEQNSIQFMPLNNKAKNQAQMFQKQMNFVPNQQQQTNQTIIVKGCQTYLKKEQQIVNKKVQQPQAIQSNIQQQQIILSQCNKCGRKFVPERVSKHQSICKGAKRQFLQSKNKFIKQTPQQKRNPIYEQAINLQTRNNQKQNTNLRLQRPSNQNEQIIPMGHSKMLVPCRKCGRRFLQSRVQKHQQCCKNKRRANIKQEKNIGANQQKSIQDKIAKKMVPQASKIEQIKSNIQMIQTELTNKNKTNKASKPQLSKVQQQALQMQIREILTQQTNNNTKLKQYQSNGNDQLQTIAAQNLKPCSKCGRKFNVNRVAVHENICKGQLTKKVNPKIQINQIQKVKNIEIIKKTKDNFFTMVKQIKNKKLKQEVIDQQLEAQLQTIQKSHQTRHSSRQKQQLLNPYQLTNHINKQIMPLNQLERVGKWKKKAPVHADQQNNLLPQL